MAYFHLSVTTGHQRDHCEGRRRPYESSHRSAFVLLPPDGEGVSPLPQSCGLRTNVSLRPAFMRTKIRKIEGRSKRQLDYAETEYLRRSQRYEKVGRRSKFICILPGASIRGVSQRRMSRRQKQARSHFVRRAYLRRCLNNGEIGKIGCSAEKNGIILLCRRAWFVVFRQNRKATARSRRRISSAAG